MHGTLTIPKFVNADGLLPFLELLALHVNTSDLAVDFSQLRRISPAGLTALVAFISRRRHDKSNTVFSGLELCGIREYLSRMNLLRLCGCNLDEGFQRRDPVGRFVPIEEISHRVDELGHRIASCIAPGGEDYEHPNADLYDTAWYLITELANNVRQHSGGVGFVAAQTTPSDGFVRIAIADCGRGIPGSLKECGFRWAQSLPDDEIIEQALVARVSSKGQPTNEGVGLTLSARIVELMRGHMLVSSLAGTVIRKYGSQPTRRRLKGKVEFPGTLIAVTFKRSESRGYSENLQKAKELDMLLRKSSHPASFEE